MVVHSLLDTKLTKEALYMNYEIRKKLMTVIEERENKDVIFFYHGTGIGKKEAIDNDVDRVMERVLLARKRKNLLLIVQTPGGYIKSILTVIRRICNAYEHVTVVVFDKAKSGGTIMALAADKILMTRDSQLGPIDGQNQSIQLTLKGEYFPIEEVANILSDKGCLDINTYKPQALEIALLEMIRNLAKETTIPMIGKHVGEADKEKVYRALTSKGEHGLPIFYEEAKELGLKVELMDACLENLIRQLYFSVQDELKEFEQVGVENLVGNYLLNEGKLSAEEKSSVYYNKYSVIESPRKAYVHRVDTIIDTEGRVGDKLKTVLVRAGWIEE